MTLHPRLIQRIQETYQRLLIQEPGKLLPPNQLDRCYRLFRERFGPERLQSLDGATLLETMRNQSNHDSLDYWLEFKDDDEFPDRFGSISGGSALKFGVYRSAQTGEWMTGTPHDHRIISQEKAIDIARKQLDEVARGAELLQTMPPTGTDADYQHLQREMNRLAPNVSNTVWGHKYFSLLYPEKLDNYHSPNYQRFQLVRLLQSNIPSPNEGRYLTAGRFVAAAAELRMPLNHLAICLNAQSSKPYHYWGIRVNANESPGIWETMRDGGFVAIRWDKLGDLSGITKDKASKGQLSKLMIQHYGSAQGIQQLF